jgi:hypothetical protein
MRLPVFGYPEVIVPIATPASANPTQYASFASACQTASGVKLEVWKNYDGVFSADHLHGGAISLRRNGAVTLAKWKTGDLPDNQDTLGDCYVLNRPGGSVIMLAARESLATIFPRYVYATTDASALVWSALSNLPDLADFTSAGGWDGLFFSHLRSQDGTKLLATAEGKEPGESANSIGFFESTDGIAWTRRGWISNAGAGELWTEGAVTRLTPTRLLACLRDQANGRGGVAISTDEGVTWSTPAPVVAAAGWSLPLYGAGMNWQGQRGYAPDAETVWLVGRANAAGGSVYGEIGSGIYLWVLNSSGELVAGPQLLSVIAANKLSAGNYHGGYAWWRANADSTLDLFYHSLQGYVSTVSGGPDDVQPLSPALLRHSVVVSSAGSGEGSSGGEAGMGTMMRAVARHYGLPVYATLQNAASQWWNNTTLAFEDFDATHIADYALLLDEVDTTGIYEGDPPAAAVTAGATDWVARLQTGGSPVGDAGDINIDGGKFGTSLSATERNAIADAYLDRANGVETGITPRQALRAAVAAEAGNIIMNSDGTFTLKNPAGDKDRVTADYASTGARTVAARDLT